MSDNQYRCNIDDLFELFSDDIQPSDVLSAKLIAQISTAITRERIKLHMNQTEFAKHINSTQSLISRWESGDYNFSIKKLSDIATKLNLDVNIFISSNNAGNYYSSPAFPQTRTIYYQQPPRFTSQKTYSSNHYQEGRKYASIC